MKKTSLLSGNLENISWRVLETYPKIIREMIQGRHGVYALYKGARLYYVGLASNLNNRIKNHLRDRHQGKWDRFSVYLTMRSDQIKELESLILRIINPDGNRASGKFNGSENLLPKLNNRLKEEDADRRAYILGGGIEKRYRRTKARRKKGNLALVGFTDKALALRSEYRGKTYRASLRPNGRIKYRKKIYKSPSAAAMTITKKPINGWYFWQYRDPNGILAAVT